MPRLCVFAEETSLPTTAGSVGARSRVVSEAKRIGATTYTALVSKASRALDHHSPRRPGPTRYYQRRDYASLRRRPPCPSAKCVGARSRVICPGAVSPSRPPAPPKKRPWKLVTSAMARSRPLGSAVDYRCVSILNRSPGYNSNLVLVTIAAAVSFSVERTRISPTGSVMRELISSSPTATACPS